MNPFSYDSHQDRNVIIANRVAVIFGALCFFLVVLLVIMFGFSVNIPLIFGISLFYFSIILLNQNGFTNLGRMLLCVVPVLLTLVAALTAKIYSDSFTDILYYDARFFMVMLSIVPCLVFSVRERTKLYSSLLVILLCIVIFDPIHEWFDVGYFQRGFLSASYPYINYVTVISFLGITGGCITLKRIIDHADRINHKFQEDLKESNLQLHLLLQNQEAQHEEILAQSVELSASQRQLLAANELIEKQKSELQLQVKVTSNDLEATTQELIKHNNELRQFSYTISHNLRGPVARLLGLTQVVELEKGQNLNEEIIRHIKTAAQDLDNVFKDLNKIVDIRTSLYQLKERVDFVQEWNDLKSLLSINALMESENFIVDFSGAPFLYSIKPLINSIFYNLVSNSLKYRSPQRKLQIEVRTYIQDAYTVLEVKDNGLGIDLVKFKRDVFKMYKRFHYEQEGRGLGLFLIRSQAELLDGFVDVESVPDQGAKFKVSFRTPTMIADQLCLQSDEGQIRYNASRNYISIYCIDGMAEHCFKFYMEAIEFCKLYQVDTLVFDLRKSSNHNYRSYVSFLKSIKEDALFAGLLHFILLFDPHREALIPEILYAWKESDVTLTAVTDKETIQPREKVKSEK